ncbi:MAG: hypothetical protein J5842_07020 [Lachnospiraceae bacterium]|nr:hypothetical protein [Lachnospiraceae bacterium]
MIIFVLAIVLSDTILNKECADTTAEMAKATFPLMYVTQNGQRINCMRGMVLKSDTSLVCDVITPVDAYTRLLELQIVPYANSIQGVSYEVRDTSGERLIENGTIENLKTGSEGGDIIEMSLILKDLLEVEKEYVITFDVSTLGMSDIYFTTRLKLSEDIEKADQAISFALDFSEKTFDKDAARQLTTYLESNEEGDNTTFAKVDIHSSFSQITWGSLEVVRQADPEVYVKRINPYVSTVMLFYPVRLENGMGQENYRIREYYYVRFGSERLYLLDYLRTMDSVFLPRENVYANNKISLGITNTENMEIKESEDGNMIAFVKENALYSIDTNGNKASVVFSFYDEENNDARDIYDGANIKILSIDETGNIRFLVRGYMNRGQHEGGVGVACYYYNSMLNTVEEEVYVPSYATDQYLKAEALGAYASTSGKLYIIADNKLNRIDLTEKTFDVAQEGLIYGKYQVSADRHLIAWRDENEEGESNGFYLYNLATGGKDRINAENGKELTPIGFVGEDLVYGVTDPADYSFDGFGNTVSLMQSVVIMDEDRNILKTYEKPGVWIRHVSVNPSQIRMERVTKNENGVISQLEDDYIMNDLAGSETINMIEVVATQNLEKVAQIAVKSSFSSSKMKVLTPRQVLYEGGRQIFLTQPGTQRPYYFVYGKSGFAGMYQNENDAILLAEAENGSVFDGNGRRIWEKSCRSKTHQIDGITEEKEPGTKSSLAVCLEAMLKKNGISLDVTRLFEKGQTVRDILEKQMPPGKVLELSGISLESALYYVGQDIPVMAMLSDGSAVLIVGYNEQNTILLNPASGKIMKMGMNDSTSYFEANGNRFIAYMKDE